MDFYAVLLVVIVAVALGLGVFVGKQRLKEREKVDKRAASHLKRSAAQKAAHARRKAGGVPEMPRNEMNPTNGFDHVAH